MKQASIRLGAVFNLFVLWSCFFAQRGPNHVGSLMIGIQFLHAARRFWNEECYAHSMEVSHYKLGERLLELILYNHSGIERQVYLEPLCGFVDRLKTLDAPSGLRELLRHLVLKPFLLNVGTISSVHRPASCKPSLLIALCLVSVTCIVLTYMVDRQKFLVKYNKVSTYCDRAFDIPPSVGAGGIVDCMLQNAHLGSFKRTMQPSLTLAPVQRGDYPYSSNCPLSERVTARTIAAKIVRPPTSNQCGPPQDLVS